MKCVICQMAPACCGEVFCETCVETLRPSGDALVRRDILVDVVRLNEVRCLPKESGEAPSGGNRRFTARREFAA